jgi:hypothetical protein
MSTIAFASSSASATFRVRTNGNDALSGTLWDLAKRTDTCALSAASACNPRGSGQPALRLAVRVGRMALSAVVQDSSRGTEENIRGSWNTRRSAGRVQGGPWSSMNMEAPRSRIGVSLVLAALLISGLLAGCVTPPNARTDLLAFLEVGKIRATGSQTCGC